MTAAGPLEWRRTFPRRPLRRLGWLVAGGGGLVAVSWLLFAAEPDRLASGETNLLSLVPAAVTLLAATACIPLLVSLFRRPLLLADHYAVTIRPGACHTLLVPWAQVIEVAAVTVRRDPLLLIRTRDGLGDQPRRCCRRVARSAGRTFAAYQLAVRMDEFAGEPEQLLAALAAWAPGHVQFYDGLG
jgi:hypothetical protein